MKKVKCLVLFSGGLDSMLAVGLLKRMGIEVVPICFVSYFFNSCQAEESAKQLGLKLRVEDFSLEHLKIVKNPKHGHGKAINPCIDCHLMMIKEAGKIMKKEGFYFIATGEVLGERPMSQNIRALEIIEKEAKLKGRLLRPLSAKLLPETIVEKQGLVNREELYDISGRTRTKQMLLAKELGIKKYPSPGGGCILTEVNYGTLLRKFFEIKKNVDGNDAEVLRLGRVFFEKYLIVVARNESECVEVKKNMKKGDIILEPKGFSGPTVLVRKINRSSFKEMKEMGREYLLKYTKRPPIGDPCITYLQLPVL
ncbi:MAG: hypothetical protein PHD31_02240 [Candidatus Pacebacteria bacterium]|nr:hypothetical protein [Candidatus Paceibacterota bacterium]